MLCNPQLQFQCLKNISNGVYTYIENYLFYYCCSIHMAQNKDLTKWDSDEKERLIHYEKKKWFSSEFITESRI